MCVCLISCGIYLPSVYDIYVAKDFGPWRFAEDINAATPTVPRGWCHRNPLSVHSSGGLERESRQHQERHLQLRDVGVGVPHPRASLGRLRRCRRRRKRSLRPRSATDRSQERSPRSQSVSEGMLFPQSRLEAGPRARRVSRRRGRNRCCRICFREPALSGVSKRNTYDTLYGSQPRW